MSAVAEIYNIGKQQMLENIAVVHGKEVGSNYLIYCDFSMHYDNREIHIFWETSGINNYLSEGLYGTFTTKWQVIELAEPGVITSGLQNINKLQIIP